MISKSVIFSTVILLLVELCFLVNNCNTNTFHIDFYFCSYRENKGLNVFNSAYVLADAKTATDGDYTQILGQSVIMCSLHSFLCC